jgi:hypothetical protein
MQIKSNEAWSQLCSLTDELFAEYGARPAAFKAACFQRPDLARVAIDPTGRPVTDAIHGLPAAPAGSAPEQPDARKPAAAPATQPKATSAPAKKVSPLLADVAAPEPKVNEDSPLIRGAQEIADRLRKQARQPLR